ncbi:hypothetical protein GCM10022631_34500 [Deinococcus rubellus]|uniref:GIY-YIG domain-containing protein n=1 Tax=Deinococcus rubellus TaxID=1889240 RepID=A0ABY5YEY8_9DEIO|nr:hypothetical protein [Deinococcus rubellus]UWX63506.1 hypothetical protein N0D28_12250 [Deinococcus rubellus]
MAPFLPPEVARQLGFYVYLSLDPRTNPVFYVGEVQGERVLAHLSEEGESRKVRMLHELRDLRLEPQIDVLAHRLPNEETALRIEAAVIDLLGPGALTNVVRGWKSVGLGRMSLSELSGHYAAGPVEITDPVLLIRLNQQYRHQMGALKLYEATRGVWKVAAARASTVRLALAVFEGVVREVYAIESWHPASTLAYQTRSAEDTDAPGRLEFSGHVAPEEIRDRYRGHSVRAYLNRNAQSPVLYVNA